MTEVITALMAKGAWAEAKVESEKYVDRLPCNADAQAFLGLCLFHEQQWEKALDCFNKATNLNPKYWQAGLKAAQCLDRLVRLDEAYAAAKHWQDVYPNDHQLNFLVNSLKRYENASTTDGWQKSKYKPDHHVVSSRDV